MKVRSVVLFAAGYIIGAKAGRERYIQIVEGVTNASQRLEEFSTRRPPGRQDHNSNRSDSGAERKKIPV